MSVTSVVGAVKEVLGRIALAGSLDEAKQMATQGLQKVNEYLDIGEKAIDPWLVKWASSKWSMPIAVGFGLALLAIGDVIQFAHIVLFFLQLVF